MNVVSHICMQRRLPFAVIVPDSCEAPWPIKGPIGLCSVFEEERGSSDGDGGVAPLLNTTGRSDPVEIRN